MADNKPALFPITTFIVSYHYARSDGLCVTRAVIVYDLFIARCRINGLSTEAPPRPCTPRRPRTLPPPRPPSIALVPKTDDANAEKSAPKFTVRSYHTACSIVTFIDSIRR